MQTHLPSLFWLAVLQLWPTAGSLLSNACKVINPGRPTNPFCMNTHKEPIRAISVFCIVAVPQCNSPVIKSQPNLAAGESCHPCVTLSLSGVGEIRDFLYACVNSVDQLLPYYLFMYSVLLFIHVCSYCNLYYVLMTIKCLGCSVPLIEWQTSVTVCYLCFSF